MQHWKELCIFVRKQKIITMIESPPKVEDKDLIKAVLAQSDIATKDLVDKINDKYEYWSDIKYKKLPADIDSHTDLWVNVKLSRRLRYINLWNKYGIHSSITNYMQRVCHEFDMNFGGSWGNSSIINDNNKEQYLISSIMEEAISSSQIEGASTTRKVAKDMLRKKMSPKDKSQQMIFNNFQTIQFIVDNKTTPLTKELLLQIHALMTSDTLDNNDDAGRFRVNDEVVVADGITNEVVHTPPAHDEIDGFVDDLCEFFNNKDQSAFIHPIIRGIIIHFMIAYMHPFVDGNGRTARAMFYWYMIKEGYWLIEYLSISRIISKTKKKYEKAYLYSESDNNDIGYFITYHLDVLGKAFKELELYIKRKIDEKNDATLFLIQLRDINERQALIIKMFADNLDLVVTVKDIQGEFYISPTTAKNDITALVNKGILTEISFNRVKKGYIRGDEFEKAIMNKR